MAVGAPMGELHNYMHDLESFFWVLFWICIYYAGPKAWRVVDEWNYARPEAVAEGKSGTVVDGLRPNNLAILLPRTSNR